MGSFSIWHWAIVLAVVMLIFGTKKLRNFGGDLGAAVRGFKEGIKEGSPAETAEKAPVVLLQPQVQGAERAFSER